jgi:hypothetical protein
MIRRRAFLLGTTATVAVLGLIRPGSAMVYEKAIEWFIELVKAFPASMEAIYRDAMGQTVGEMAPSSLEATCRWSIPCQNSTT